MRRLASFLMLTVSLVSLTAGCTKSGDPGAGGPAADPAVTEAPVADSSAGSATPSDAAGTSMQLTPENTHIQFVGNHTGDDPNPRTGHFQAFSGELSWDPDSGALRTIQLNLQTSSLATDIPKLTNHLHSADFFDVNEYPDANFVSTSIQEEEGGTQRVAGNLTLLGNTQSIQFPVQTDASSGELRLTSEFSISRSRFGMTFGLDNVEDEVILTVTVNGGVQ
jgi:polyisoprenoid-binding protein YceI